MCLLAPDPPIEQVVTVVEDGCWVVIALFSLSHGSHGSDCHCRGLGAGAIVPCAIFSAGGAIGPCEQDNLKKNKMRMLVG